MSGRSFLRLCANSVPNSGDCLASRRFESYLSQPCPRSAPASPPPSPTAIPSSGNLAPEAWRRSTSLRTFYLAQDLRHDRQVAVKVLRPELAAVLGADRFLNEIRVTANLQHPHILPLFESGEADGFVYYVMPLVEGESLRDKLDREGALSVGDTARVLSQVADALSYAHSRGVLHRDIKPDNIMVSGRHAMVMDIGVARAVTEATEDQALTTAGMAIGTPAYMAPEQAARARRRSPGGHLRVGNSRL